MSSHPGVEIMSSIEASNIPEDRPDSFTNFPGGTVTFLFTDIEGSTELLKSLREQYTVLLVEHRNILREVIAKWNGYEVDTQGDAFFFSFARATQAVSAAVEAQFSLAAHPWPKGKKLLVRMGLHTGEPWKAEEGYTGIDVHRAARIAHAGHGGQVLLSETTTPLVIDELPQGVGLLNLGCHLLKDLPRPERIHQVVIEGLPFEFPPLKSLGVLPQDTISTQEILHLPGFLQSERESAEIRPVFVARNDELEKLDRHLRIALSGQGDVVFITGGPGQGKTALMNEFSWQAIEHYPDLLVVKGSCDAYSGEGDPYLPFRDILAMLTGDLEMLWSAGLISHEQARRLWKILPEATEAVLDHGVDLINRLLSARDLLTRAQQTGVVPPDSLGRLQVLVQQISGPHNPSSVGQAALFGQYTNVLSKLAKHHPIVLILDDLQWIDIGSINLLFHLGRRLAGNQILLVGSYRSEDVAQGRGGDRHPLEELLAEFKRQYGDIWIDLDNKDAGREQQFVEAYLDTEPNRFSQTFRQALYEHTEGHPLFTIELLRNLQEQGDLTCDDEGRWVEKKTINWQAIPSRVEGVIEERIGRLEQEQHEILSIGSVEGEDFTAQVIARIRNLDESGLLRVLSQSLDRQHRLIIDRGIERLGDNLLFLFAFRHNLFQRYLYDHLTEPERVYLHQSVGEALETIYSGNTEKISPQLARHFDLAGLVEKAVKYYVLAGKYAIKVTANHEAIAHFNHALQLLKTLPASPGRSQQELDVQLSLGPPLTAVKGWAASELESAYDRARELCAELTDDSQMMRTLYLLATYWLGRSEHDRSENIVEQIADIAKRKGDPQAAWMGVMSVSPFYRGNLHQAREKLEMIRRQYEPTQQRALAQIFGMAPSVVSQAYLSQCLWLLGYPEMAKRTIEEAFAWGKEVNIPFTNCYVLGRSCWLYSQLDDWKMTRNHAETLLRISREHLFRIFEQSATFYIHYLNVQAGFVNDKEIERMYQAMEAYSATGTILNRTSWLVLFAEACTKTNHTESGLTAISEAISLGEKTGELWVQAEAYRLKGELFAQQAGGADRGQVAYAEAEECLLRAIEIARSQAARSLELRAAISLVRLSECFGNPDHARQILMDCYQSFTEGFNTPDLIEARTLLNA